jgi:hypothetical protein
VRRRFLTTAAALTGVVLVSACATPQLDAVREAPGAVPRKAEVVGVPFFPQTRNYCGPAALATVLAWTGLSITPDGVAPEVFTPGREGTLAPDMIVAARRNGRLAVPVAELRGVLAELAAGHPVVVFQNLGLEAVPIWHFAVAYGYDLDAERIWLRSGEIESLATDLAVFERTWRRTGHWALVVLPPDRLPASADEESVARAAAGLEAAGRSREAATTYAAALQRWPKNLAAAMGLGNARYAAGDMKGAEAAFRAAATAHPGEAAAWNNLAHALARQGRRAEAIRAAERAVAQGGPHLAAAQATLAELKTGR